MTDNNNNNETKHLTEKDLEHLGVESTLSVTPPHLPQFQSPNAVILVFADNSKALQFELTDTAMVGRRFGDQMPDVDLALYGGFPAGVSRNHARFFRQTDRIFLEDLGSANGTFHEERRLQPGEMVEIRNGQGIRFAQLQCWCYFRES